MCATKFELDKNQITISEKYLDKRERELKDSEGDFFSAESGLISDNKEEEQEKERSESKVRDRLLEERAFEYENRPGIEIELPRIQEKIQRTRKRLRGFDEYIEH